MDSIDHLWALLSDGKEYSVSDLCTQLNIDNSELYRLKTMLPESVQNTLHRDGERWKLSEASAFFSESMLMEFARVEELHLQVLSECESTNTYLINQLRQTSPEEFRRTLCITNRQTQGRGRQEKQWVSRAGDSLTFSLGFYYRSAQTQISALPLVAALSCQKVLSRFGLPVKIKWPNDLVVESAKLGGILVESIPAPENGYYCVIGVGINYRVPDIVNNIGTDIIRYEGTIAPSSLLKALVHEIVRDAVFFFQRGFSLFQTSYIAACRDNNRVVSLMRGSDTFAEGKVLGVDGSGALLLEKSGVVERFVNGEISLRSVDFEAQQAAKQWVFLDCGNSQVKYVWMINREIVGTFRTPYTRLSVLGNLFRQNPHINRVFGSAVCGEIKKLQVVDQIPLRVEWLYSERLAGGIRNHYRNLGEHGADRWFNALGARRFSKNACVVVSCGTAVTVDALTTCDQYLGGSILPGFNLMKESLAQHTANLDRPFGRIYPFATTTSNAIASGIMDAVIGAILLMHARLVEREAGQAVDVILTGGGAGRILAHLPPEFITTHRVEVIEHLVIHGLLSRVEEL